MAQAIGGVLPLAVRVALSPIPVIAVVLILTTRRARVNGSLFVRLAGRAGRGRRDRAGGGGPGRPGLGRLTRHLVSALKLTLGVALLALAVRQLRGRPRDGPAADLPNWMAQLDGTAR